MKYIDKYPNMKKIVEEHDDIMRGRPDNCYVCGQITEYIDIDFCTHICSDECSDILFNMFLTNLANDN